MGYTVHMTAAFRRDYKLAIRRGLPIEKLDEVIRQLAAGVTLDEQYHDHALSGNFIGFRECHVAPNWLLVYYYTMGVCVLTLARTGTHSDIFGR